MVVDLAIDGERAHRVVREERLVARERVDDGEALVGDRRAAQAVRRLDHVDTRAVGAAVADKALECQCLEAEGLERELRVDDGEHAAHLGSGAPRGVAGRGQAGRRHERGRRSRAQQNQSCAHFGSADADKS